MEFMQSFAKMMEKEIYLSLKDVFERVVILSIDILYLIIFIDKMNE